MTLSLDDLANELEDVKDFTENIKDYPDLVPNRVAHIDADFLAYMASYEHKDHPQTLDELKYKTLVMIEDKRRECAAERTVLHLTPSGSDKGGRYAAAIQKEYQAKRVSEKPRFLGAIREYMAGMNNSVHKGVNWFNAEADDGMSKAAWDAYDAGESNLVVVATKDKDLRMVPGLHLSWDTGIIEGADDTFGYTKIFTKVSKSGKKTNKIIGYGTKFFWTQMLMGDTVDNIQGVPKITIAGKKTLCGQMKAYEVLDKVTTDRECMKIVMDAYKGNKYTHWDTGEEASWSAVFWSEAQLLWMQRNPGEVNDVKDWVKGFLV